MDRRGFIGSILAACAAPAIVRADSLMRIVPRDVLTIRGPAFYPASIDLSFTSADLTLTLDDYQRRALEPMWQEMADNFDRQVMAGLLTDMGAGDFLTIRRPRKFTLAS